MKHGQPLKYTGSRSKHWENDNPHVIHQVVENFQSTSNPSSIIRVETAKQPLNSTIQLN